LSGTLTNCAGGKTPWGSWISCEEITLGQTVVTTKSGRTEGGFLKPHGYCFEVPASANNNLPPVPLKAMGRFVHEAIAVDKKSGTVYLTEDNNSAGFYRFLPKRNKRLAEGGVLQMLVVKDKPNLDTRKGQKAGATYTATWTTIDNPDPIEADVDSLAVYKQGQAKGAATFSRLEGCYADNKGGIYFTATDGGDTRGGQIWKYEPRNKDEGRLTLLFESPSRELLDMPDNICLHPKSDLLFILRRQRLYWRRRDTRQFYANSHARRTHRRFCQKHRTEFYQKRIRRFDIFKRRQNLIRQFTSRRRNLAIWGDWDKFRT
jgi:secreted PhoX family phosphatase